MICFFMNTPRVTNISKPRRRTLKTIEPIPEPEAIALSKVYVLLIRAARQRKMTQTKAAENVEMGSVFFKDTTEISQSKNLVEVLPPTPG